MQDGWTASVGCGNGEERSFQYVYRVRYVLRVYLLWIVSLCSCLGRRPTPYDGYWWRRFCLQRGQEVNNQLQRG